MHDGAGCMGTFAVALKKKKTIIALLTNKERRSRAQYSRHILLELLSNRKRTGNMTWRSITRFQPHFQEIQLLLQQSSPYLCAWNINTAIKHFKEMLSQKYCFSNQFKCFCKEELCPKTISSFLVLWNKTDWSTKPDRGSFITHHCNMQWAYLWYQKQKNEG